MQNAIFLSFIWLISFNFNCYSQNITQLNNKKSTTIVLILEGLLPETITHDVIPTLYSLPKNGNLFSVESIGEILNKNNLVKVEIAK